MPNFFKKIGRDTNHFFKKTAKDANHFFKKDVTNVAKQVGGALEDAGKQTLDGLKNTGNFLEKNAGIIGDVAGAGLMASGFGAPLGLAVMAGGNVAQQAGTDLKNTTSRVRKAANALGAQARSGVNQLGADIKSNALNLQNQAKTSLNNSLASAKAQTNALVNDAANQLNTLKFAE